MWSRNQPKHRARSFECPISFPVEKIQADKNRYTIRVRYLTIEWFENITKRPRCIKDENGPLNLLWSVKPYWWTRGLTKDFNIVITLCTAAIASFLVSLLLFRFDHAITVFAISRCSKVYYVIIFWCKRNTSSSFALITWYTKKWSHGTQNSDPPWSNLNSSGRLKKNSELQLSIDV